MTSILVKASDLAKKQFKKERPVIVEQEKIRAESLKKKVEELVEKAKQTLEQQLPSVIYEAISGKSNRCIDLFQIPDELIPHHSEHIRTEQFKIKNEVLKEFITWIKEQGLVPVIHPQGQWRVEVVDVGVEVPQKFIKQLQKEANQGV